MTRHGRNATASAVYTYHEKKKDSGELYLDLLKSQPLPTLLPYLLTAKSGYGSKTVRLGKDSIKVAYAVCVQFNCSLQTYKAPLCTCTHSINWYKVICACLHRASTVAV